MVLLLCIGCTRINNNNYDVIVNDVIENMEITDDDIIKGKGTILKYRAIYLDSLKSKYKSIETNNLFDDFINNSNSNL